MNATVRIMNSHDYGHFEVTLSEQDVDIADVEGIRQQAQKLVRDAIASYKIITQEEYDKQASQINERELPF